MIPPLNSLLLARHGAVLAACAVLLCLVACGRTSRQAEVVLAEARYDIAAGRPAIVEQALTPGAYSISIREDGIDLATQVTAAGDSVRVEDPIERHGRQMAYLVLPNKAVVKIELSSTDHRSKTGHAFLEVVRWVRARADSPSMSELGDRSFSQALEEQTREKDQWSKRADKSLNDAIRYYSDAADDLAAEAALYTRGRYAYLLAGDWPAAESYASAARAIAKKRHDPIARARADVLSASAQIEQAGELTGDQARRKHRALLASAEKLLAASEQDFAAASLPIDQIAALTFRGVSLWSARNADEARAAFVSAADLARTNKDAFSEVRALGNLAWLDFERADVHAAAAEYERLLEIIERDRQPDLYASHVANYGLCLVSLGEFDRALQLHNEALEMFARLHDDNGRAKQLLAIGGLLLRSGDPERALDTLQASLALLEQQKDQFAVESVLRLAGNAAAHIGDSSLALSYHSGLLKRTLDRRTALLTKILVAGDLRSLGRLDGADEVLAEVTGQTDAAILGPALIERGLLREAQRRYPAAASDFAKADALYADLDLAYPRIETNTGLSRVELALGNTERAIDAADMAISIVSSIRMRAANPELRARFVASEYSPYETKIAALLDQANKAGGNDQPRILQALFTAEDIRARSLREMWSQSAERRNENADADQLRDNLTIQQLRLENRLQRYPRDDPRALELRRSIEELRAKIDGNAIQVRGRESSTSLERTFGKRGSELQRKIPNDTTILYFFVGDKESTAWIISRESLAYRSLPNRLALTTFVDDWVESLRQRPGSSIVPSTSRHTLASLQELERLVDGLGKPKLVIAADGPLNALPFASLGLKNGNETAAWIDRFEIGFVPSLSFATQSHDNSKNRQTRVAIVADPVYAKDDLRLTGLTSEHEKNRVASRSADLTSQFVRLPFSSIEAASVAAEFKPADLVTLTGFAANAENVAKLPSRDLRVLHFATHALTRADSPGMSALYLSAFRPNGLPTDRSSLSADDIYRLGLRADLVVLSACSTNQGRNVRGEGVLGLTHSFLANGSGAVVATLWPVDDAQTSLFMREFYRTYRSGASPPAALRAAQQSARQSSSARRDALWASFVVRESSIH